MAFKIANKLIGEGHPCCIIAEAGANFRISDNPEINFKQALKLIDIAAEAKADAVKFQLYRADTLYAKNAGTADYIGKKKPIFDIIKEMELPYEWLPKLKSYCDKAGIIFLCTPFDESSADILDKIGMPAFKIASYSINNIPLLNHIAKKGKPMLLSTGASEICDIEKAISTIKSVGNNSIAILQCTAKYPAPLSTLHLRIIPELMKKFQVPVGISDHSRIPHIAPMGAVALGAKLVEKHYTTDNSLPGPDQGFAILPDELKDLVLQIRQMEEALGSSEKKVLNEEQELHDFARSCIFAKFDIPKGAILSNENLIILRPGKGKRGLEPEHLAKLTGMKASHDISKDEPITLDIVE